MGVQWLAVSTGHSVIKFDFSKCYWLVTALGHETVSASCGCGMRGHKQTWPKELTDRAVAKGRACIL
jgi:hypothetical protein